MSKASFTMVNSTPPNVEPLVLQPSCNYSTAADAFSNPVHYHRPSDTSTGTYNATTGTPALACEPWHDIDLEGPPITWSPNNECVEADHLTPTLTNLSDVSATSYDGWSDFEVDINQCVKYDDVHMKLAASSSELGSHDQQHQQDEDAFRDIVHIKTDEPNSTTVTLSKCEAASASGESQKQALKRPKNGFIRFAMKYRTQVAASHPRLDNRDVSRILGVRWRKLTAAEKAEYEEAFHMEMSVRKAEHPGWRYGGERQHDDIMRWEPFPSRLRPRDKLKRRKIPELTRAYMNRRQSPQVIQTNWVQCDRCNKWRQLPCGADMSLMPNVWYCEYNWPPKNHCDADEDQEDPEEEQLTKQLAEHMKTSTTTPH